MPIKAKVQGRGIMNRRITIITTWPVDAGEQFREVMTANGISLLSLPMIEIADLSFRLNHDLEDYHWIVFTSKNGVHSFLRRYSFSRENKIAVIGSGTAKALRTKGYEPHFTGSGTSGVKFSYELAEVVGSGQKVLLALGNLAPNRLKEALSPQNQVERVDVYQTRMPENVDENILKRIIYDDYTLIAVSSPSGVKNLMALVKDKIKRPLRLVSIGETTSDAACRLGIEPLGTSPVQSYYGLAQCALQTINHM